MTRDELNSSPGSVIRSAWDFIKPLLFNDRGNIGTDPDDPDESGDWDVEGKLSPDKDPDAEVKEIPTAKSETKTSEEPEETPKPSEETLKPQKGEPEPEEEEEEEEVEGEKKPSFHDDPKWKEMETRLQSLEADNANLRTQSQFYETQLNEALGQQSEEEVEQDPGKLPGRQEITQPTDKLPEGIRGPQNVDASGQALNDGSGWDTQKQMAQYIDSRASTLADKIVTEHPYFKRTNEVLIALSDIVARMGRDDFDEVVQHAYDEVFNIDPNNGKVISVKNEGLLRFFRAQPIPALAAYDHGLKKLAPQKIKEGKRKAVKETLEQIEKKPKKVTDPKASKSVEGKTELDWDTPSSQVEKILDQEGLLI